MSIAPVQALAAAAGGAIPSVMLMLFTVFLNSESGDLWLYWIGLAASWPKSPSVQTQLVPKTAAGSRVIRRRLVPGHSDFDARPHSGAGEDNPPVAERPQGSPTSGDAGQAPADPRERGKEFHRRPFPERKSSHFGKVGWPTNLGKCDRYWQAVLRSRCRFPRTRLTFRCDSGQHYTKRQDSRGLCRDGPG